MYHREIFRRCMLLDYMMRHIKANNRVFVGITRYGLEISGTRLRKINIFQKSFYIESKDKLSIYQLYDLFSLHNQLFTCMATVITTVRDGYFKDST